jgi:hypothetical protein
MNIFPLISLIDFVSINLATLENIDQCEVTLWRLILIKTKMFVLKILKYITTSIKTRPIGIAAILQYDIIFHFRVVIYSSKQIAHVDKDLNCLLCGGIMCKFLPSCVKGQKSMHKENKT